MTFTAPFGLLGLLAVPAVVLLHLYRRRLQERRVAAVFLFAGERLAADAGRTRTRLLRTPSLWCETAMALLLALWLAGPSLGGVAARHVVFALDDSASMAAGGGERAVAEVRRRLAALASDDRVTLLRTGPRGELLAGPRALPSEATAALADYRPTRPRHDPLPALDLARELAAGGGEVVFVTDEPAPFGADELTVIALGEAAPNAAILSAQRFPRERGGEELRIRVGRFGALLRTELTVRTGDAAAELVSQPVELAGDHADVAIALPPDTGAVLLELAADALDLDNRAWLLPEPERAVRVCDVLATDARRRLGLDRVFAALHGHVVEPDPLNAQLLIAAQPGRLLAGQTEVVIAAVSDQRDGWRGPFVVDRGHSWLNGLELHGVVWLAGRGDPPGRVLAAVGNRTLISEEYVDAGRRLWLNLDPSAGNLMRSPDWPLLFANVLESCRDEVPGPVDVNVVIGDEARYRRSLLASANDAELWLETPAGRRERGRGDRILGWVVTEPGLHRVRDGAGAERAAFAVRFHDPAESDLRGLVTATVAPTAAVAAAGGKVRDTSIERRLLGLLLFAVAVLDWWLLARRRR
ncbi:MAG: BatA and WFA domain-containing protein [Planctomycetes bacterium]|nr:BatA and WFA domain-containing protein [Planctomycetota bacterium]